MANATYDLGRVGTCLRGNFSYNIAYEPLDIVTYQNGCYIANAASTGKTPDLSDEWTRLAQGEMDYAVTDMPTGERWIDDRPIYRRILTGTHLNNAGSTIIGNIGPVDAIIRLDGFVRRTTGGLQTFSFAYYNNLQQMVTANVTKEGNVVVYKGNSWDTEYYAMILYYCPVAVD